MDNFPLLILITIYTSLNILTFGIFVLDKHRAKTRAWRIPENTLLAFAAVGPFGALAAMKVFRHKTRHTKFLLIPVFVFIHLLFAVNLFTPIFR